MEASWKILEGEPIETPGCIGTVERYHAPLRAAFVKIRAEVDGSTPHHECLRMAVFEVNSTVGPEGLCPILMVFDYIRRPARTSTSAIHIQRGRAIESDMKELEQEQARRRLAFG